MRLSSPVIACALLLVTPPALRAQVVSRDVPVDVLIHGATVYDGTGSGGRVTDIGLRGDRIVFVGPAPATLNATLRIEATGLIASPGFIDPHTHSFEGLPDISAERRQNVPALMQGVTTVVVGADGRGPFDVARVLAAAQRAGIGTNTYTLVGFGTVREQVLGESGAAAGSNSPHRLIAKLIAGRRAPNGPAVSCFRESRPQGEDARS